MILTPADVKQFRRIDSADQAEDEELERLIDAVQAYLEDLCGRQFEQKMAQVDLFDGGRPWAPPLTHLLLTRPPVRTIATLHDDPLRQYGAGTLVPAANYVLADAEGGIVLFDGYTPRRGICNLKIVYDGGYLPEDDRLAPLRQAAIEMIWAARNKGVDNIIGVRSKAIADGSIAYLNHDWPMNLTPILERFKLDVVR